MLNLLAPLCIARRLIVQEYCKGRLFYIIPYFYANHTETPFTCTACPEVPRQDRARAMPIGAPQSAESMQSHNFGEVRSFPCGLPLAAPQGTVPEPLLPVRPCGPDRAAERRGQTPKGASARSPTGAGAARSEIALAQASRRERLLQYGAERHPRWSSRLYE